MNVSRAVTAATLLPNGQVLISGGNSTSAGGRSADLYSNGAWSLITSMSVLRRSLTATLLSNGDVLVFGGSNLESTKLSASEGQASIMTLAASQTQAGGLRNEDGMAYLCGVQKHCGSHHPPANGGSSSGL